MTIRCRMTAARSLAEVICVTIEKPAVRPHRSLICRRAIAILKLRRFVRGLGSEHLEILKPPLIALVHAAAFFHPRWRHARI